MLMAHRRPERELHVNRHRDCNRNRFKGREFLQIDRLICEPSPKICRHQRDDHEQSKERLRDAGVKDSDFIFHHGDANPAKNSLQDYASKRNRAQLAHPLSIFAEPKPDGENDG